MDYSDFDIHGVKTSVKSPDMNAYAERVISSVKREALDNFIIVNKKQIYNILKEYVDYYNHYRPLQGIGRIPEKVSSFNTGKIMKKPILSGLHHHYYRSA